MRYHWLARHLVQERFPKLDEGTRNQLVSEAVCRAWCSFLVLDYRLMQSCVAAAAERHGLVSTATASPRTARFVTLTPRSSARRAPVIHLSDYR